MDNKYAVLVGVAITLFTAQTAKANNCSDALIVSMHSSSSKIKSDWRLSIFVSEEQYNKMKNSAGANARVYGVPVGANYSQYKASAIVNLIGPAP